MRLAERSLVALLACILLTGEGAAVAASEHRATVPSGYRVERLATGLGGPRLLRFAPDGALVIGSKSGVVWRLEPPFEEPGVLLRLDDYPHSVAFRSGNILVAQTDGIYRASYAPRAAPLAAERWVKLPSGGGHNSRTVGVGPNGRVHAALGLSGNCSDQHIGDGYTFDDWRGGILVLDESVDPPRWQPFSTGLRNPVGFDWHPRSGELYATNNGPDHHGYDEPVEYFVHAREGAFFGFPWYVLIDGEVVRDDCVGSDPPAPIDRVRLPVATFPARNAPLGMAFAPLTAGEWAGDAFVALHGSWATRPFGGSLGFDSTRRPPAVVRVEFDQGRATGRVSPVVEGFQDADSGDRWARPAGVVFDPAGNLYFTSDQGTHGLFRVEQTGTGGD